MNSLISSLTLFMPFCYLFVDWACDNAIKKDVRLVVLRPQNRGIAKRLIRMNIEETIFPRRKIYVGSVQKAHYQHIHRMSIDCFGPLMKILAKFLFLDFNKMLSYVNGFFPHWRGKDRHFLATNAHKMRKLSLPKEIKKILVSDKSFFK